MASEDQIFQTRVASTQEWMDSKRFEHVVRPYNAEDVVKFQGTTPLSYTSATVSENLYGMMRDHQANGTCSHTFGALDPVQVVEMANAGLTSVYVSGWQSSSTASTSNEPGPDVADYPMDTVPNKVEQLFKAQHFHDRKQFEMRRRQSAEWRSKNASVNYLNPIIADADTGHGGLTATMKLCKMFVEAGASGIHIEDQVPGTKKCGHMGGKVLVSTDEHCNRLVALRLQADILQYPMVIIARTDAEAATMILSNIDPRDHPFIKGATVPGLESLIQATNSGTDGDWEKRAGCMTFVEAVAKQLQGSNLDKWFSRCYDMSLSDLRTFAKELGAGEVYFDWELARSVEGFYRIQGCTKFCAQRAKAFAPYADAVWMETATPGLQQAREFRDDVLAVHPHLMLAYNNSPSFNWDAAGMTDEQMRTFIWDLAKMGYCWQFITLAGFHQNALGISLFSRAYKMDGMKAYVQNIQRQEREKDVSTLTHQKWSGSEIIDAYLKTVTGGKTSTSIMGAGVTEDQFKAAPGVKQTSVSAPEAGIAPIATSSKL